MNNYSKKIRKLKVEIMALGEALNDVRIEIGNMDRMYDYELDPDICRRRLEFGLVHPFMRPIYEEYVDLWIQKASLETLIHERECKIEILRREYKSLHSHDWYRPMDVEDYLNEIIYNGHISGIKL